MPPLKAGHGATLVELLIGILLLAIATSAMVGSLITAPLAQTRSQNDQMIADAINSLANELRNYVTADATPVAGCAKTPAPDCPPGSPLGTWKLPGDTNGGWALAIGDHDGTSFLPAPLQAVPYNGTLTYTVSCSGSSCDCTKNPCQIAFSAQWTPP